MNSNTINIEYRKCGQPKQISEHCENLDLPENLEAIVIKMIKKHEKILLRSNKRGFDATIEPSAREQLKSLGISEVSYSTTKISNRKILL